MVFDILIVPVYNGIIKEKEAENMKKLAAYTANHLAVDLGCFTVLFAALRPCLEGGALVSAFLFYNVIAFGLQAPIGALADRRAGRRECFAAVGSAVTALGLAAARLGTALTVSPLLPLAGMAVAALGNAFFHAGAGSAVLRGAFGRIAPAGVFNCAGALGVGLGTYLGSCHPELAFTVSLTLLLVCTLLSESLMGKAGEAAPEQSCRAFSAMLRPVSVGVLLLLLLASAAIHGAVSGFFPRGDFSAGTLVLVPAAMICLGKLLGGFLADRFGSRRVLFACAVVTVPLLFLPRALPVAILFFNMAVPVTQCAAAGALPEDTGFAFGLTKLALLVGTCVTYAVAVPGAALTPVLALGVLIALLLTALALRGQGKANHATNATKENHKEALK